MRVYLDIETLPAVWTEEQIEQAARSAVPGNYTKPETIEKWIAENREEIHRRTALDGFHARLLCVGIAIGEDDPASVLYSADVDEGAVLRELRQRLQFVEYEYGSIEFCGHNVASFDLPMLRRIAWRTGEKGLAGMLPSRLRAGTVIDSIEVWRGTDIHGKAPKLSALAAFFNAGEKADGIDGSHIYGLWLAGEHERIQRYCRQDVELTRTILQAML